MSVRNLASVIVVSADGISKELTTEEKKIFWRLIDKANN